jgi:hypothetical protein
MANSKTTQTDLILQYHIAHPKQPLEHGEVVDWVTVEWLKTHSKPPRDIWRARRKLHENGILIKVKKGVYMYDPDAIINPELEDFTPEQKKAILERDNYRCLVCGLGVEDGVELTVDHVKPKSLGGSADIDNGETLCTKHNLKKKNYGLKETGKRMYMQLYKTAKRENDDEMMRFVAELLEVFERHNINGHIQWKR